MHVFVCTCACFGGIEGGGIEGGGMDVCTCH